ncbi:MAG: hypothetical protein NW217_07100 [Hyphomicrobiaceae bacterium]|nr:hypothetical protein [Hyphomicrobiaceae bacterium]
MAAQIIGPMAGEAALPFGSQNSSQSRQQVKVRGGGPLTQAIHATGYHVAHGFERCIDRTPQCRAVA